MPAHYGPAPHGAGTSFLPGYVRPVRPTPPGAGWREGGYRPGYVRPVSPTPPFAGWKEGAPGRAAKATPKNFAGHISNRVKVAGPTGAPGQAAPHGKSPWVTHKDAITGTPDYKVNSLTGETKPVKYTLTKARAKKLAASHAARAGGINRLNRIQNMAMSLPTATKSIYDQPTYGQDNWLKSVQAYGIPDTDSALDALEALFAQGIPAEAQGEVAETLAEMEAEELYGLQEIDDYEAELEEMYVEGYEDAGGDPEGGEGDVYAPGYYNQEPELYYDDGGNAYVYDGDDGQYKAVDVGGGDAFEGAAQALAARTYEIMTGQPAIKSAGFSVPAWGPSNINTYAPHGYGSAHMKAFDAYMRKGPLRMSGQLLNYLEDCTKAAMVEDTDGEGGYLLPDEFSMDLIKALYNESWVRTTDHRSYTMLHKTLEVPAITASAAATRKAEAAAYDESEPTASAITFTATKAQKMSKVTRELLADSRFPIWEQVLKPDYTQSFAEEENTSFTTGSGTTGVQPQGCLTGATAGVTSSGTTAFSADDVKALYNALDFKYRRLPSVAWMMSDATMGLVRLLKDGQGRYLLNGDLSKGEPETLIGKPIIINNGMPATATGTKPVLFGAFTYYGIADRQDMRIQRLEELYAISGEVGFLADMRNDAKVLLASALTYMTMS